MRTKGLAVLTFNGYRARLASDFWPNFALRSTGPYRWDGAVQPARRLGAERQRRGHAETPAGPLRRGLARYRGFLTDGPAVIAGDLNNNAIWDRPGWRINHMAAVEKLASMNLVSAYHAIRCEPHGQETAPTIYWRDRDPGWADLSHRLYLPASGLARDCRRLFGRRLRQLVRQWLERSRTAHDRRQSRTIETHRRRPSPIALPTGLSLASGLTTFLTIPCQKERVSWSMRSWESVRPAEKFKRARSSQDRMDQEGSSTLRQSG